jgi:SAM-dependent methyltransferase
MPFERPILDIGCGEGLFGKILFAEDIDTGIDPNPLEIERARELGAYRELIVCKGDAIPKPDGHYRTIFSNSVIEHIPDLEPVLREARRLLSPRGRLYLTVPSDRFDHYTIVNQTLSYVGLRRLAAGFRKFFNRFWKHYHCYPPAEWENITRRAGFTVVSSFTYAPRAVCLLNDALAPLGILAFVIKRIFNRWTLFPALRRVVLYPVCIGAKRILRNAARSENGGLVFIALTRS